MAAEDSDKLNAAEVARLYLVHGEELKRFLQAVLRDPQRVNDTLQAAFARLVESGHTSREESRKSWLFRVAYHEAMAQLRRESTGHRHLRQVAWTRPTSSSEAADLPLLRMESVQRVQTAMQTLPRDQQQVVRLRIYENKTFAEIAEQLRIPLGTALSRMRAALGKLRQQLDDASDT